MARRFSPSASRFSWVGRPASLILFSVVPEIPSVRPFLPAYGLAATISCTLVRTSCSSVSPASMAPAMTHVQVSRCSLWTSRAPCLHSSAKARTYGLAMLHLPFGTFGSGCVRYLHGSSDSDRVNGPGISCAFVPVDPLLQAFPPTGDGPGLRCSLPGSGRPTN